MGLRFRKSVKICKGVKVNFGKTGASLSVGTRGLHHTIHTSGRRTTSAGIPGTGLSYVSSSGGNKKASGSRKRRAMSGQKSGSMNRGSSAAFIKKQQAYEQQKHREEERLQQLREDEYVRNCEMVDDYNELIDQIRSIHEECTEPVDWVALRDAPPPFNSMYMGPFEMEARNALDNAKPSFIGRFIPATDRIKMRNLEDAVRDAQEKDRQMYNEWENLKILANQVLNGNIDSYFYVVSEMHPFDEILDFGSDFDIGTDFPNLMEVEFHAKTSKVVPNHVLSLTKSGKLSSKQMTKSMHSDIVQDYVCSCVLRVAREMFALLPIDMVIIHTVDTVSDNAGNVYDDTVLSVLITRNQIEAIDFDMIDASDTIETFKCNMNFKKTQGLRPVPRIEF